MARTTREYLSSCSGASMTAEADKPPLQRISFASALTDRRHNVSQMLAAKSASESEAGITTT